MQLRAPAKVNLSFRIRGRRADGFHEIETLMTPVSIWDTLTITRRDDSDEIEFVCDDPALPTGNDNLVVRAAGLFRNTARLRAGLKIQLEKKIPHGAGLGGGSSDAATTLLGLNELLGAGLSQTALSELAAQIGSDVAFFIYRSAATCRGRGDKVEPLRLASSIPLLLLKPAFGVPTPWAYSRWKEASTVRSEAQEFTGIAVVNELEPPVFEKFVFLAEIKKWLLAQPEVGAALLSGSGSTVFAALHHATDASRLAERARAELDPELWTWVCETVR
jgi:4-diphosphocytidyl-2-C-methyl-D-erythritol kinase